MVTKMDVKINPEDSVNITHISSFYDNVARTLGFDNDAVRYDCTKIDVSRNIQNNIFSAWEKMGASDLEIGMVWCNSGPKTDDKLAEDTVRLFHGFFVNENEDPLPFDAVPQKPRATERAYIEGENTRVLKDQLKELGCKWDRDKQQWYHTDPEKANEAQKLVNGASTPERGAADNSVNRAVKEASRDR